MNDEFHLASDKKIPTGVRIEVKLSDGTHETITLTEFPPIMPLKGLKRWKHRLLSIIKRPYASKVGESRTVVAWRLAESDLRRRQRRIYDAPNNHQRY